MIQNCTDCNCQSHKHPKHIHVFFFQISSQMKKKLMLNNHHFLLLRVYVNQEGPVVTQPYYSHDPQVTEGFLTWNLSLIKDTYVINLWCQVENTCISFMKVFDSVNINEHQCQKYCEVAWFPCNEIQALPVRVKNLESNVLNTDPITLTSALPMGFPADSHMHKLTQM